MKNVSNAIVHLIVVNVLFFLATQLYGDQIYQWFSLWFVENPNFEWWQVITHMFMHGDMSHIFFNMFALWMFGAPLLSMWGSKKFFFFYFSAGIGAAIIHSAVNYYHFNTGIQAIMETGISKDQILDIVLSGKYVPDWYNTVPRSVVDNFISALSTPAVGASGAVYGILVAYGMLYPNSELLLFFVVPVKAKYFIPVLLLMDLFSGLTGYSLFGGGIAHFAHLGGALFGFIMMWYWKKNQFNKNRWN